MRCVACNCALSDVESTRKSIKTHEYLDLCNKCYSTISEDVKSTANVESYGEPSDEENEEENAED